jgi:hypothetical protein
MPPIPGAPCRVGPAERRRPGNAVALLRGCRRRRACTVRHPRRSAGGPPGPGSRRFVRRRGGGTAARARAMTPPIKTTSGATTFFDVGFLRSVSLVCRSRSPKLMDGTLRHGGPGRPDDAASPKPPIPPSPPHPTLRRLRGRSRHHRASGRHFRQNGLSRSLTGEITATAVAGEWDDRSARPAGFDRDPQRGPRGGQRDQRREPRGPYGRTGSRRGRGDRIVRRQVGRK